MQAPENAQRSEEREEGDIGTPGGPGGPDPTGGGEGALVDGAVARELPEDQGVGQGPMPRGEASAPSGDSTGEPQELYPS